MIIQSLSSVTGSQWFLIFLSAALIGMAKGGVKGAGMLAVPLMAGILWRKRRHRIGPAVLGEAGEIAADVFHPAPHRPP
ncbi:MAG TPA: hypothetical protein PKB07_26010, partial [Flavilitoribacter sp.]|nr:hypothetical protein [Flavilitoribacter sp.]